MAIRCILLALFLTIVGCGDDDGTRPTAPPPWQRTETREPCRQYNELRNPYFGDLHIHTQFSADAYIYGTRVDPRGAYQFAQGQPIPISDELEAQTRSARLDRPLDFAAVTDHSEFYGEVRICTTESSSVFDGEMCRILRQYDTPDQQDGTTARWLVPAGTISPPPSLEFCNTPGIDCDAAAVSVWQDIQAAAEEAYDRTSACRFTTFIGYEHTTSPGGRHLHRNIIFRNSHVPAFASSHLETARGGIPEGIWTAVERDCLNAGIGCEALIIPHNPNLSGGFQFRDPADAAAAQRRQNLEPLVEIHQIKASSECRFDRLMGAGVGTNDELCTFEQEPLASQSPFDVPLPVDSYPRRNMVRNALKDGLALEQQLGVNPFKLGFVGSTDTHNATAGNTGEIGWVGAEGNHDASPALQIARAIRNNPGGLAVVWAEENSRDAIFSALRRRETYATSGTRPIVRFFAGDYGDLSCDSPDLLSRAYRDGVSMGGDLAPHTASQSPQFIAWAMKDVGTTLQPGTDLQRIQIVKGWVDSAG